MEHGRARRSATVAAAPVKSTILLVNEDPGARRRAVAALRGIGLQVLQAGDGRAALELLDALDQGDRQRHPVDLVLAGTRLPGLNGPELAFALAHLRPGLPVLLLDPSAPTARSAARLVAVTVRTLRAAYGGRPIAG